MHPPETARRGGSLAGPPVRKNYISIKKIVLTPLQLLLPSNNALYCGEREFRPATKCARPQLPDAARKLHLLLRNPIFQK